MSLNDNKIRIKLNRGEPLQLSSGVTPEQILTDRFPNQVQHTLAARYNNELIDLSCPINENGNLEFVTDDNSDGLNIYWHSSSHIMAQAVKRLFPGTQLGIGPSISKGFYYDFKVSQPITSEDLPRIEQAMQEIVNEKHLFKRELLPKQDAIALFRRLKEPFKIELIEQIEDDFVSVYRNGRFVDLCRGPHVPNTQFIRHFKLISVAGSYWHGDERNAVMQRIYGISFPDKKQLKAHLLYIEEAKKRDHRKIGKALDLFSFQPEGPGFPFWHPKGVIVYNQVIDYLRQTLNRNGYLEIKTPLILNESLWHMSGHWDNYKENMYFTQIDDQSYAVKPMNCPGGLLVFKNSMHSYRDFPLKISEMGLVHRHEKSGVLHGLFRVRMFTQDDAHVYCMPEQIEAEVIQIINLIEEVYSTFGFYDYDIELSTRPLKSIGSDEMWQTAEKALENALKKRNISYQVNPGDGAFYGPKIDYHIRDSLDRTWQCGTIQVDFSMPERFSLEYIGPDNEKHRPVMIHRAILGSIERFIGILIEHYAGDFPLWLAPVQCAILPITEKHIEQARAVLQTLKTAGIRCHLDDRNEKIGFKIRDAEMNRINYMGIIGDNEVESDSVSLRQRKKGNLGILSVKQLTEKLVDEIQKRRSSH